MKYMKSLRYMILCIFCCVCVAGYAEWTEQMYEHYTYNNYTTYAPFNQSVVSTDYDANLMEAAIFYETNRQRALNGLPVFGFNYNLMVCAHNHSVEMVRRNFFDHTSPVPGEKNMSDRLTNVGIRYTEAAENIALCPVKTTYVEAAKTLLNQWMNSPGHRRNILNPNLQYLGCGAAFYYSDYNVLYVKATQNFMTPMGSSCPGTRSVTVPTTSTSVGSAWTAEEISNANKGAGASYLTDFEKKVIMYLNLARLYPKKFAATELSPYTKPQGYGVRETFPEYKQSLMQTLSTMNPVGAIVPDYECYQMAYCWAEESSRLGLRGHKRVDCVKGYAAECCSYGVYTPIDIVLQWLIDDNVPGLGHRTICLSSQYTKCGVSFMKHSTEDHVTVLDLKR